MLISDDLVFATDRHSGILEDLYLNRPPGKYIFLSSRAAPVGLENDTNPQLIDRAAVSRRRLARFRRSRCPHHRWRERAFWLSVAVNEKAARRRLTSAAVARP